MTGAAIIHRIHAFETRAATAIEARVLEIEAGSPVISLRRVRSVAHVPLAIDDRVMSIEMAARLNFNIDTATESIIDLVQRKLTLSKASWELTARLAGERDAILLQIAPTDPILIRSLVYFEMDKTPILTGETRHRSDMLRCGFEMDLTSSSLDSSVQSWTNEAFLAVPPPD
ncbi:MAG: GntR family transcriptional regulator [Rhizobiales bacterium]|nr:GntR family transcriptional regulator [Hyphomicrobiales bacterium]